MEGDHLMDHRGRAGPALEWNLRAAVVEVINGHMRVLPDPVFSRR